MNSSEPILPLSSPSKNPFLEVDSKVPGERAGDGDVFLLEPQEVKVTSWQQLKQTLSFKSLKPKIHSPYVSYSTLEARFLSSSSSHCFYFYLCFFTVLCVWVFASGGNTGLGYTVCVSKLVRYAGNLWRIKQVNFGQLHSNSYNVSCDQTGNSQVKVAGLGQTVSLWCLVTIEVQREPVAYRSQLHIGWLLDFGSTLVSFFHKVCSDCSGQLLSYSNDQMPFQMNLIREFMRII